MLCAVQAESLQGTFIVVVAVKYMWEATVWECDGPECCLIISHPNSCPGAKSHRLAET